MESTSGFPEMRKKASSKRPRFFATPNDFRVWLEQRHSTETELLVGFYKKDCGRPSMTWPGSVDAALCYGWIDGIRHRIDEISYQIRFTPRTPSSTWSAINIRRVAELTRLGLMHPAGIKAFQARQDDKTAIYSYEQRKNAKLSPAQEKQFRANKKAWAFFRAQPPSYQRTAIYFVVSAKQEATREKRLARLIHDSDTGQPIKELRRPPKRSTGKS